MRDMLGSAGLDPVLQIPLLSLTSYHM